MGCSIHASHIAMVSPNSGCRIFFQCRLMCSITIHINHIHEVLHIWFKTFIQQNVKTSINIDTPYANISEIKHTINPTHLHIKHVDLFCDVIMECCGTDILQAQLVDICHQHSGQVAKHQRAWLSNINKYYKCWLTS